MPKRSDRRDFSEAFESNPFEAFDPEDMYAQIQWAKEPEALWDIESPEPLVAIGDLAGLDFGQEVETWSEEEAPYLAVGRDSNVLYVVPKDEDGAPAEIIPVFNPRSKHWKCIGAVRQTDYYSSKGNEAAYYYHEHEAPFPQLWEHSSGVRILVPATHKGARSYAVSKEGIVG